MYIHLGFETTPFLDIPPPDFLSRRIGMIVFAKVFGVSNMPAVTGDWMTCFPEVQCEFAGGHQLTGCQIVSWLGWCGKQDFPAENSQNLPM